MYGLWHPFSSVTLALQSMLKAVASSGSNMIQTLTMVSNRMDIPIACRQAIEITTILAQDKKKLKHLIRDTIVVVLL